MNTKINMIRFRYDLQLFSSNQEYLYDQELNTYAQEM